MMHIYKGIAPFVLVQLLALALCMWFPESVLYLPRSFGFLD
jgi:TRAP-type mannitol/chloroaromatic compound transport system permease large subunit